jgi:hypothetical protein
LRISELNRLAVANQVCIFAILQNIKMNNNGCTVSVALGKEKFCCGYANLEAKIYQAQNFQQLKVDNPLNLRTAPGTAPGLLPL